jgi:hypothetical protein
MPERMLACPVSLLAQTAWRRRRFRLSHLPVPLPRFVAGDGAFSDAGPFHPVDAWDAEAEMKLFRERLLARLIERHTISEDLAHKLLAWRHPDFSAHVGRAIPFLGRNFEALDPLEWLARLADHIPDTGKHRTHSCAYYANRVRGQRPPEEVDSPADQMRLPRNVVALRAGHA